MTVKIDGVEPNIFPDVEDLDARDAGRNVEVFLDIRVKATPQPQPRFFCPPWTLPATRRCVRYPIEAFTKAGKEKRPGVSRAPPCRCATGRPAAARALLQHCRVIGRSHISAMELSVWKVYPAQTSELNEDSRIKVVRPANTPAPQGCVSRSRRSARTAGPFFWGGQSGRR